MDGKRFVLELRQLTVSAAGRDLLRDVNVVLRPGELLGIIGPNGAGKTTLLRAVCGEVTLALGEILLDGRPRHEWRPREQAQKRAVLMQNVSLNFPFTSLEVVLMGRSPHHRGRERARDVEIAHNALEQVQLSDFAQRNYLTLSGGEKQRVQLARVLAQVWEVQETGNRYLFLDEPTNNLDLAHQHHTLMLAWRFKSQGAAVLVVLHDLNLAAQYADRILLLHHGQVFRLGIPQQVLTAETLEAAFDIPVVVTNHPKLERPLIVPIPQCSTSPQAHAVRAKTMT